MGSGRQNWAVRGPSIVGTAAAAPPRAGLNAEGLAPRALNCSGAIRPLPPSPSAGVQIVRPSARPAASRSKRARELNPGPPKTPGPAKAMFTAPLGPAPQSLRMSMTTAWQPMLRSSPMLSTFSCVLAWGRGGEVARGGRGAGLSKGGRLVRPPQRCWGD